MNFHIPLYLPSNVILRCKTEVRIIHGINQRPFGVHGAIYGALRTEKKYLLCLT